MPKFFVTSDVHSHLTPFIRALGKAGYDPENTDHWLVICGDVFDRGDESLELLKYLTNAQSSKTITDATGMIPANKNVETNYAPNSPEDILMQQLAKTSISRPVTPGYPQFSSAFASVISSLRSKEVNELVDAKAQVLQQELNALKG